MLIYIPVILILGFGIGPFLAALVTSFLPVGTFVTVENPFESISNFSMVNYSELFTEYHFPTWFINSTIVSVVSTLISIFCSCLAGYSLSRFKVAGRRSAEMMLLISQMMPVAAIIIPLYVIISRFALTNTLISLILVNNAITIPFSTMMMRSFFDSIPRELEDAALTDGCTPLMVLRYITLPLVRPGLFATAIFAFTLCWQEFLFAVTFNTSDTLRTLTTGMASVKERNMVNWGILSAAVVVATIPVAILFALVQKQFVHGLTKGALKG